ncbi:WecB/TagA/CpsF family glycosyltransferase [Liquorilactobacillus oeni]|uniref:N-acetylglucosaminyldiphosphoundecaprenol N-acetyl-beta-D-mannosaminyltransferase n=1 Tax=Liquorilactobacillus oeni DSM 19972 TaxID=1423777 RepID=A0A0R1MHX3_9LACO|nr:WecB/TagA/CpsF family glycosyltransferase [Liquorilactobacillus oeni]KRL04901.1 N-acetylglucosaminyldiphosphoundecaprenol N-acetyl-beta-D-mannosaminyltransferase [Liquorilactobacillus oeni DSM 19972]
MKNKYATVDVLGVSFTKITNRQLVNQLILDSQQRKNCFVVTANPEIVLYAREHPEYAAVLQQADYTAADGIGIIKGAQILKSPLPERVTGFDTLISLLQYADRHIKSIFLLGAKPDVVKAAKKNIQKKYPRLKIAGYHDGYFTNPETVVSLIRQSSPDFVFVALGFPKQEFFIKKFRSSACAIWMGVGGSFDVLAGNAKRAPLFWQRHHIEWLYRLVQEPTRIKRIAKLPVYLFFVLCSKYLNKWK